MQSAKVTFSNNDFLIINEDQYFIPIVKYEHDGEILSSIDKSYKIWYHISDGLIPSITELICRCEFFKESDKEKVYKSSSVVCIEHI